MLQGCDMLPRAKPHETLVLFVIYFALKLFKNIDFYIKRDAREAYPYFLPEQECNLVTVLQVLV